MSENPVGRPSMYRAEYCELLIEHMEKGLSFESFAGVVGVTKKTIYSWVEAHEEFLNAKEVGLERSRIFWEQVGIDHVVNKTDSEFQGGSSSRSLNASVWIFNMKNRFGWRDKQPGEDAPAAVVNNNQVTVSDEKLVELIKKARGER